MARRKRPKILYIDDSDHLQEVQEIDAVDDIAELPASEIPAEDTPPEPTKRHKRMGPNWVLTWVFAGIALVVTAAFIFIPADPAKVPQPKKILLPNCLGFHPEIEWGYELHTLECSQGVLSEGQDLSDLLLTWRINYKSVIQLLQEAQKRHLPKMEQGNAYTLMHQKGNIQAPYMIVYEPGPESFVLMNLHGEPLVHEHKKAIIRREQHVSEVVVKTTLAEEMYNRMFGLRMTRDIEEALRYKVDLFHLSPGDQLRLLYDEAEFEGGHVDVGKVMGIEYSLAGEKKFAFWFEDETVKGYFDIDGYPMIDGFLKAPLEFGRISSPYNPSRPDPVSGSGEIIPHLGTDYAAPEGTPILAVGKGQVLEAGFGAGNGNYVKLFHTDEIQTQYLHMSAFADGIAPGVEVRQGQVIGYVGSPGRSTGPHVCFRFWKNGIQVDHRKERSIGAPPALIGPSLERFQMHRDTLMSAFSGV